VCGTIAESGAEKSGSAEIAAPKCPIPYLAQLIVSEDYIDNSHITYL